MEFYPDEECEDESCRCLEMGACCYVGSGGAEHGNFYCRHQTQEECLHADPNDGEIQGEWMGKGSLCETHCAAFGRCCIPRVGESSIQWECQNTGYEECYDLGGFFNQHEECPDSSASGAAQCNEVYLETLLHLLFGGPEAPSPALLVTPIPHNVGKDSPKLGLAINSLCDDIEGIPIRADWYWTNMYDIQTGLWVGLWLHVHDGCCCQKYLLFEKCCTEDNDGDGHPDREYAFALGLGCDGLPEEWAGASSVMDFVSCYFSILLPSGSGGHIVDELPEGIGLVSLETLLYYFHFVPASPSYHQCQICCEPDFQVVDLYDPCPHNESYCDQYETPPQNCKDGAHRTHDNSDSEPYPMLVNGCRCYSFFTRITYEDYLTGNYEFYQEVAYHNEYARSCGDCGFQIYKKCPENENGCSGDCVICHGSDDDPERVWACKTALLNSEQIGCSAPRVRGMWTAESGNLVGRCYSYVGDSIAVGEEQTYAMCLGDLDSDGLPVALNSCCDCCSETSPCQYNCECMPTSITLMVEVNDSGCGGGTATFAWVADPMNDPDQVGYCEMVMRVDNLCGTAMCRDTPPDDGGDCIRTCDGANDWFGQISPEQYFVRELGGENMRTNIASCVVIEGLAYMAFGGGCNAPKNCDECGSQNCDGCLPCTSNSNSFETVLLPLSDCGPCA